MKNCTGNNLDLVLINHKTYIYKKSIRVLCKDYNSITSLNVSITYLRRLEAAELKEEDMPML